MDVWVFCCHWLLFFLEEGWSLVSRKKVLEVGWSLSAENKGLRGWVVFGQQKNWSQKRGGIWSAEELILEEGWFLSHTHTKMSWKKGGLCSVNKLVLEEEWSLSHKQKMSWQRGASGVPHWCCLQIFSSFHCLTWQHCGSDCQRSSPRLHPLFAHRSFHPHQLEKWQLVCLWKKQPNRQNS